MNGIVYSQQSIFQKYDNIPTTGSNNLVDSDVTKQYVDTQVSHLTDVVTGQRQTLADILTFSYNESVETINNTVSAFIFEDETAIVNNNDLVSYISASEEITLVSADEYMLNAS